jgi:hypothetical protein
MAVSFIGGGNQCPEKTTDLSQFTDKLYNIVRLALIEIQTQNISGDNRNIDNSKCFGVRFVKMTS